MNGRIANLRVALIICIGLPPAGHALQVLEAVDHAELDAEISDTAVNRVALEYDRIVRVIQAPGGLVVEHDPVRGDIYVRAQGWTGLAPGALADMEPLTLYIGTERGLTYRLSMRVAERDSAQILIRNGAVAPATADGASASRADSYTGELVELIRAVARNEPPPGYRIGPAPGSPAPGGPADGSPEGASPAGGSLRDGRHGAAVTVIETWRGRRYAARVLSVPPDAGLDAEALAVGSGTNALAAWVSEETTDTYGARRGVVVELNGSAGTER